MEEGRIRGFDGLRALAATSVVLTHLGVYTPLAHSPWLPVVHGTTGVQLFFVLSGFLITTLLLREEARFGDVSLRAFYVRRICRIFPLYYLIVLAAAGIWWVGVPVLNPGSLLAALSFSYNFVPRLYYSSQLGHLWSLAVEEHFYLIWPILFVKLPARLRLPALLFAWVAMVSAQLALSPSSLGERFFVSRWSITAGADIALGCITAIWLRGPHRSEALRHPAFFVLGLALYLDSLLPFSLGALAYPLRGLGLMLIVVWVRQAQDSRLVSVLELWPLRRLGVISYGIYMYQGLFLGTGPVSGRAWPPAPWIGLGLIAIAAPLSYRWLEQPLLEIGRRYTRARRQLS